MGGWPNGLSRSSLVLVRLQGEIDVCGDGDVEGSELVGLIGRRHNQVAVGVSIEDQLLAVEAPRNELKRVFIQYVVFSRLDLGWVYIETYHGADERHADLFLPGFFGPAECDLDGGRLARLELEQELGILHPGEGIRLLLELLVVQVAASGAALVPR